jgi:MFS transporter, putative metabolite:H+ symporter
MLGTIDGNVAHFRAAFSVAVLVASLGYFVDIYDLLLFSIVRVKSLADLGLSGPELVDKGLLLINMQMAGMLIGGVLFGILGDKRGRLKILFGSILLYSLANILNGLVQDYQTYAVLRFFAGIGLAGELGAGVALVSESLPKESRGLGTMIIASVGVSGAVLAWYISETLTWRHAYFIGGFLGLILLVLRFKVTESAIFAKMDNNKSILKGNFFSLFTSFDRFKRYLSCILIGVQFWFMVGILITLASEFAQALHIQGVISDGRAVMFCYAGLALGDCLSGLLSYLLKSRKRVLFLFLSLTSVANLSYFYLDNINANLFYIVCFLMGMFSGYWALLVTVAAENFGSNLRTTVATTVPNFVRGALLPISAIFSYIKMRTDLLHAGMLVAIFCILLSFIGLAMYRETYHTDLDFYE